MFKQLMFKSWIRFYLGTFALLVSWLFLENFFLASASGRVYLFSLLPFALACVLPLLLDSLPREENSINKFFHCSALLALALLLTLPLPAFLLFTAGEKAAVLASGYLGIWLTGELFLCLHLLIARLIKQPVPAAALGTAVSLLLLRLDHPIFSGSMDWLYQHGLGFLLDTLFVPAYYADFALGTISCAALFYFISAIALCLALAGLQNHTAPKKNIPLAASVFLLISIFMLANLITGSLTLPRWDLTRGRIVKTAAIFDKLSGPISLEYYVSPHQELPYALKNLRQETARVLKKLARQSKGKISVQIITAGTNAAPQSETGITPFAVEIAGRKDRVYAVYSDLVITNPQGKTTLISHIVPEDLPRLEYQVCRKILQLQSAEKTRIAVAYPSAEGDLDPMLQSLLEQLGQNPAGSGQSGNYGQLLAFLNAEGFEITRTALDSPASLPADTDILFALEPENLGEKEIAALQAFLEKGGKVLLALQKHLFEYSFNEQENLLLTAESIPSGLDAWLNSWGLEILPDYPLDNLSASLEFIPNQPPLDLPLHILLYPDKNTPEIARVSGPVLYLWGSILKINAPVLQAKNLRAQILLQTSRASWSAPAAKETFPAEKLEPGAFSKSGPFPAAILLQGKFSAAAAAEAKLAVIGAAALFQNNFADTPAHRDLLLNIADDFSGHPEFIALRGNQASDPQIKKLSARRASTWRAAVLLFPLLCIFILSFRPARPKKD